MSVSNNKKQSFLFDPETLEPLVSLNDEQSVEKEKKLSPQVSVPITKKQIYTKECIEWLCYIPFLQRMTNTAKPVVNEIDPLYVTSIQTPHCSDTPEKQNFFSALMLFQEYQDAAIYLKLPQIQNYLYSPQQDLLLNLSGCRESIKKELIQERPNPELLDVLALVSQATGIKKMMHLILFNESPNQQNPTHKEKIFPNTQEQTALGFLIEHGFFNEALEYMKSLPTNTTLKQLTQMLNTEGAQKKLSLLRRNPRASYSGNNFMKTMEKTFPTDIYLKIFCQQEKRQQWKDDSNEFDENMAAIWLKSIPNSEKRFLFQSAQNPTVFLYQKNR